MKNSFKQPPPLRVWIVLLCIVLLLGALSWPGYVEWLASGDAFALENSARISAFGKNSADGKKRVVALGNSLLYEGTFFDREMEFFAQANNITNINFLRIAGPSADLSRFLPLFAALWRDPPDILLVQKDLLLHARVNKGDEGDVGYGHYLKALLLGKTSRRRGRNVLENKDNKEVRATGDRLLLKKALTYARVIKKRPPADIDMIFEFLAEARQHKVQVVILDMPRHAAVEEVFATDDDIDRLELMRLLREKYRLPWLQYPARLSADYFMDYTHLNLSGRKEYSRWLLTELEKLLKQKETL